MTALAVSPAAAPPRPSLARLTGVELRKMTDTRAGRWLLALVALTGVVSVPIVIATSPGRDQGLQDMFSIAQLGPQLLLPVVGILAVTAEWSQRTALTTFALVPVRWRVAVAKLLAGAVLGLASLPVTLATAVAGRGAGGLVGRSEGSWHLPSFVVGTAALLAVTGVLTGMAFGMLLMNTPLAITLNFVLPVALTTLTQTVHRLRGPLGWVDLSRATEPLSDVGVTSGEWARVATALAVWLAVPLAAGVVRLNRREIN
ncbi:ABC-2 family transporter protein [Actinomadura rubteroloni]|uniref:ABC-2 family transporter protein n=1 Tax=Actinomadura rubteroloni TaxID=1926885 RepID=A0A2P4UB98_9ACTN|nr:ABC transporter permease [Actinomadura rubteroloni]POM22330.1 ABC-2 family transporter protein [Actinomadura rubteroloni]